VQICISQGDDDNSDMSLAVRTVAHAHGTRESAHLCVTLAIAHDSWHVINATLRQRYSTPV